MPNSAEAPVRNLLWAHNKARNTPLNFTKHSELWLLFCQNWETFRPKAATLYRIHRDFRLFFLVSPCSASNKNQLMCTKRYFAKWLDSYNFMFNLFYATPHVQLFSSNTFIEEVLTFNWHYSFRDYKLFKFTQPFFMFSDMFHGPEIHCLTSQIMSQRLDFGIVLDVSNQYTLLQYIQAAHLFTIGLVPVNHSPWQVSYPIITFSDSLLSQYYFIRWIFYVQSLSTKKKYDETRGQWAQFQNYLRY